MLGRLAGTRGNVQSEAAADQEGDDVITKLPSLYIDLFLYNIVLIKQLPLTYFQ